MSDSYMFFRCDEYKSAGTMNPLIDSVVYRGKSGRRMLFDRIMEDAFTGCIEIEEEEIENVKNAVLNGNPEGANYCITYGIIIRVAEVGD
jgi:glutamyl-tRNA synthetase 1